MNKTKKTLLIAGLTTVVLAAVGMFVPLMYDLNDDITLRSIVSGAYSGVPDGHAVYMKYPLTGIISLFYRISRSVPWFSLFMAGCFVLSISSVLCRTIQLVRDADGMTAGADALAGEVPGRTKKAYPAVWKGIMIACMALFCAGLFLMNFMKMHYTIVAAMLGGTALFLVVTGFQNKDVKAAEDHKGSIRGSDGRSSALWFLWKKMLPEAILPAVLLILCYDVRSQVFFLLLPFLGVALLWQVWNGRLRELVPFVVLLAVGAAVCMIWDGWMYRDGGWKAYEDYNESRTMLYDYTEPLPYETYREVYEELGITEDQYRLLVQYDTALDRSVDQDLLQKAAEASVAERDEQRSQKEYLRDCLVEYYYYLRDTGKPYNYLIVFGYLAVLAAALLRKRTGQLFLTCCMGAGRSLIWIYLIWKGRFPERIYVSLYLLELMLLAGMLLELILKEPDGRRGMRRKRKGLGLFSCAAGGLLCLALAVFAAERFTVGYQRAIQQQKVQAEWNALQDYCISHEQELYLLDVTSMVAYSGAQYEKLPEKQNYLLAGGWMSNTPLLLGRLEELGVSDGAEALAALEQVSFIAKSDRDLSWLEEYMVRRFGECRMEKADTVEVEGQEIFTVYRFY